MTWHASFALSPSRIRELNILDVQGNRKLEQIRAGHSYWLKQTYTEVGLHSQFFISVFSEVNAGGKSCLNCRAGTGQLTSEHTCHNSLVSLEILAHGNEELLRMSTWKEGHELSNCRFL